MFGGSGAGLTGPGRAWTSSPFSSRVEATKAAKLNSLRKFTFVFIRFIPPQN